MECLGMGIVPSLMPLLQELVTEEMETLMVVGEREGKHLYLIPQILGYLLWLSFP